MATLAPGGESAKSAGTGRHSLFIDDTSHATVTGVVDVSSFHETEVVLRISSGDMILTGKNLHIAKLLLEEGQLYIDGSVDSVIYEGTGRAAEKKSLLRRLTK